MTALYCASTVYVTVAASVVLTFNDSPPHLVMVELRLAGRHLSLLGVVVLLASDSTEHVKLLTDAARHRAKPEQHRHFEG